MDNLELKKSEARILGARIVYYEAGADHLPVLLMVHGFRGNHRGLMFLAGLLKDKYRLIIPDLPGYGDSDPFLYDGGRHVEHDFENFSRFLEEFVKFLKLDEFVLLGHSFGGSICIYHTAKRPAGIKKLILISPVVDAKRPLAKLTKFYYLSAIKMPSPLRHKYLANKFVAYLTAKLLIKSADSERRKYLINEEYKNLKQVKDPVVLESLLGFYKVNLDRDARVIKLPTLIIGGRLDQLAPAGDLQLVSANIKDSELVIIEGTGHFAPLEAELSVARPILNWL